jgi:hypothetical protein
VVQSFGDRATAGAGSARVNSWRPFGEGSVFGSGLGESNEVMGL